MIENYKLDTVDKKKSWIPFFKNKSVKKNLIFGFIDYCLGFNI